MNKTAVRLFLFVGACGASAVVTSAILDVAERSEQKAVHVPIKLVSREKLAPTVHDLVKQVFFLELELSRREPPRDLPAGESLLLHSLMNKRYNAEEWIGDYSGQLRRINSPPVVYHYNYVVPGVVPLGTYQERVGLPVIVPPADLPQAEDWVVRDAELNRLVDQIRQVLQDANKMKLQPEWYNSDGTPKGTVLPAPKSLPLPKE
jgi:hypothetical protein